jgi:prepilin-type processing-associated H-X9-DG protein
VIAQLSEWAQAHVGADAVVDDVARLPGNAGLGYAFTVTAARLTRRLVVRLAAPGVPERGPNDVLRQVPLLQALQRGGIPVAPVVWAGGDPAWFGSSAVISAFLPGRPLHVTRDDLSADVPPDARAAHVLAAVDVLAAVHRLDARELLGGWAAPTPIADEVARWAALLERAHDGRAPAAARRLAEALACAAPARHPMAIQHGDFQTNNVLFADGRVTGVVDWELAGIGDPLLDVAWLMLFCDPACWAPDQRARLRVVVAPEEIADRYGAAPDDLAWHRALACLRFAAIIAYNLRLHRTGRRVDATWEDYARSASVLLVTAERHLGLSKRTTPRRAARSRA